MTPEQTKTAFKALESHYLSDSLDANKFLDLNTVLRERPAEFWEEYFRTFNPTSEEAKILLVKLGPDATLADLKTALQGKESSSKTHTQRRQWKMRRTQKRR